MALCLNCNKSTKNPKFCSSSCSASYNNRLSPKRRLENTCITCGIPITSQWVYCASCRPGRIDWEHTTVGDLKKFSAYVKSTTLRYKARRSYLKSGKPLSCEICGYSHTVHIAHIKPVISFPDDTSVSEVNHIDNLIALCPNHHWEFDHNLIVL